MIRSARPTDQAYIASTWTRSICSTHKVAGVSSKNHAVQRHIGSAMWDHVSKQVDAVMDRSDSRALVVCKAHDHDAILGWIVYAEGAGAPLVHYLYTRSEHRGRQFGAELLHRIGVGLSTAVVCTSLGPSSQAMRSRYKAAVYMPIEQFLNPTGEAK